MRFLENYSSAKEGDEGVITSFWNAGGDPKGGVAVDANDTGYSCYTYRVAPVVAEATATEREFKKGDLLRCVDDETTTWVRLGETYEALDDADENYVTIHGDTNLTGRMSVERFELIEPAAPTETPAAKFKVGDRVRLLIDEGEDRPAGSVGTVDSLVSDYGAEIEFDDPFDGWGDTDRRWYVDLDNLELVTSSDDLTVTFNAPNEAVADALRTLRSHLVA